MAKKQSSDSKLSVVVIILLLIAGLFYWFQIRPANIRSNCVEKSVECATAFRDSKASAGYTAEKYQQETNTFSSSVRDRCYIMCLNQNGINK